MSNFLRQLNVVENEMSYKIEEEFLNSPIEIQISTDLVGLMKEYQSKLSTLGTSAFNFGNVNLKDLGVDVKDFKKGKKKEEVVEKALENIDLNSMFKGSDIYAQENEISKVVEETFFSIHEIDKDSFIKQAVEYTGLTEEFTLLALRETKPYIEKYDDNLNLYEFTLLEIQGKIQEMLGITFSSEDKNENF